MMPRRLDASAAGRPAGTAAPAPSRSRVAALVVTVALAAACGGDDPAPGATTTVDTIAGTIHVRHAGRAPEWRLEPVLTLGELGGLADTASPSEFGRVSRVLADVAGRIYVADALAHEIRVFGPDGTYLRTLGRQGGGPGEIGGLQGMEWLAPDTMLVMDHGNARLTRLTVHGEQVGQWQWAPITGRPLLFNGGEREAYAVALVPGGAGARFRTVWTRYRLGEVPDTLEIPTAEAVGLELPSTYEVCSTGSGALSVYSNEFAPSLRRAPAPDLERVVAVSTAYRVVFLDPAGDTTRVIHREIAPAPLPDTAWARVEEEYAEWRARWGGGECEGGISRPRHMRVIRDLYFDRDGRLLVEHHRADGVAFDVFDRDARWLGTFAVPDRDETVPPYLFGDRLYTVAQDSLGVQQVQVHRLGSEVDPGVRE